MTVDLKAGLLPLADNDETLIAIRLDYNYIFNCLVSFLLPLQHVYIFE